MIQDEIDPFYIPYLVGIHDESVVIKMISDVEVRDIILHDVLTWRIGQTIYTSNSPTIDGCSIILEISSNHQMVKRKIQSVTAKHNSLLQILREKLTLCRKICRNLD